MASEKKVFEGVAPLEAFELITKKDYVLLDVRTPEEFAKGHFGGAINVPVSFEKDGVKTGNPDFTKEVQEKLAEENTAAVICTCYGGRRGGAAADQLIAAGFEKTQNLLGGMGAWAAADLPIEGELQKH